MTIKNDSRDFVWKVRSRGAVVAQRVEVLGYCSQGQQFKPQLYEDAFVGKHQQLSKQTQTSFLNLE